MLDSRLIPVVPVIGREEVNMMMMSFSWSCLLVKGEREENNHFSSVLIIIRRRRVKVSSFFSSSHCSYSSCGMKQKGSV